ncbi:hypothetical protein [Natronorubrum daqingense]|uniref:Uncharacterized protein n=1 Tax=Natronorubrum daqingense TaxID=588898 RepID=A0A1N7C782_9EURY|nr:hypothetical protein [Natronorubrum daqingense]APX96772.1 hypothetical protein BB347_09155 [Natronorubrum daqingense]SIR59430.1 hypothetical protein SAMN05421809_1553 [Natronorubrum daqingense]
MASLEYYDKLLLAIAGSLILGVVIGVTTSVAVSTGIAGGSVVATVFVYEAIFRNPPGPVTSAQVKATAVVWHAFLVVTIVAALL